MRVVYVAGPFRAANSWDMEQNIRKAEELALEAWRAGFAVICPHSSTRYFHGAAPDDVWLRGDLEILARCDAVLLTPDWERSEGTRAEVAFAQKHSIRVCQSLDELISWDRARHGWSSTDYLLRLDKTWRCKP
jgi:nucleoside 2-deoxyribosyltransferase